MLRIQIEQPAGLRSIEFGRGAECQWTHHDGPEHGQLDIPRLAERLEETLGTRGHEPIGHPLLGRFYLNRRLDDHEIPVMSGTQFRGHGVADGSGFAKISGFNVIRDVTDHVGVRLVDECDFHRLLSAALRFQCTVQFPRRQDGSRKHLAVAFLG